VVATTVLTACAGDELAAPTTIVVPGTVAIGGLPGPFSDTAPALLPANAPTTTTTPTTTTEPVPPSIEAPVVDAVSGHRILLVGDTALAATTPRFDGPMCDRLTDAGWDVVIEAEPGRSVEFAADVLDERLDPRLGRSGGWDVVGLMFGHHVPTTPDDFARSLDATLDRIGDRAILLYTVAESGPDQIDVNRSIRAQGRARANVVIIDWAADAAAEPDLLLDDGGPYPTDEGADRLATSTSEVLGEVPEVEPGECFDPLFVDDSAIVI
jgi:hypothetical protein